MIIFLFFGLHLNVFAATETPYIDLLKQDITLKVDEPSYTESKQKELFETKPKEDNAYVDQLKELDPEYYKKVEADGSYTTKIKSTLSTDSKKSAIQSVKDGTSDLKPNFGKVTGRAMGFKISTVSTRTITFKGGSTGQKFDSIYKPGFVPELLGFYEFQPFNSEIWGSFGIQILGGLSYQSGSGVFRHELTNPVNSKSFGATSQTKFQFFTVPLMVSGVYRFNLAKYIRPYVFVGPSIIGYVEMRNDEKKNHKGTSKAIVTGGGVNILLNPLTKDTSWEVYQATGAKRYYLTIDFTKYASFSGLVRFNHSVLALGFTFEH